MKIGYARVSTDDQSLDLQLDALRAAGCEKVYEEKVSGAAKDRPQLAKLVDEILRVGDTLTVWRLDRLGRSLPHLVKTVEDLKARGVGFESLQERIETETASGRLVFHVFAALADFERNIIRERTHAGLAAARARGRTGGRKALDPEKVKALRKLAADRGNSPGFICKTLGISRATLYKYLRSEEAAELNLEECT